VLFPEDATDPTVGSGTSHGVLSGLREWGVDVVPIDVRPSARLERAAGLALALPHQRGVPTGSIRSRVRRGYSAALVGADLARLRSATGSRRLLSAGHLDGVVQLGAGYSTTTQTPLVVHDDMTLAQALRHPYAHWQAMRRRDVEARLAVRRSVHHAATTCCMTSNWTAQHRR
jgi:hypothetical protein